MESYKKKPVNHPSEPQDISIYNQVSTCICLIKSQNDEYDMSCTVPNNSHLGVNVNT